MHAAALAQTFHVPFRIIEKLVGSATSIETRVAAALSVLHGCYPLISHQADRRGLGLAL